MTDYYDVMMVMRSYWDAGWAWFVFTEHKINSNFY